MYTAAGWASGIAWNVVGEETVPDEDFEWDGIGISTGKVIAHMVGDDRMFSFNPDDLTPIDDLAYCAVCGQVGCTHDGRER